MPPYFFDASALVKAYVHEPGSRWVRQILTPRGTRSFISPISGAEVLAAIARKARAGEIQATVFKGIVTAFRTDFRHRFAHAALSAVVIDEAMALVLAHPLIRDVASGVSSKATDQHRSPDRRKRLSPPRTLSRAPTRKR